MTELTADRLRDLFHYGPDTGIFTRLIRVSNAVAGSIAGSRTSAGYLSIWVDGKPYLAHRMAFLYMTGRWPISQIDHRDGIRTNNKWGNLREATAVENATNRRNPRTHTSSGLLGAKLVKSTGRWRADITIDGKYTYLGTFATSEEAQAVFLATKRKLHSHCNI